MESNDLLILRAIDFAARKHRDQRRKDQDASSFINHPEKNGATRRTRTGDLLITNQLLYQLS
jgi:hypothetical protein